VRYIDTAVYIRIEIRLLVSDCEEGKKKGQCSTAHFDLRKWEKKKELYASYINVNKKKKEGFTLLDSILAPGIKGHINRQPALSWVFLGRGERGRKKDIWKGAFNRRQG
jgi:hypothetical protein